MNAALALVGKGRHFASLGIREVTRQAGVVPTSFYRHFRNMDDLGLQLVDELGLVLRRMMREARANVLQADKLIDESVGIFISHARNNRSFFMFMAQGLAGESRAVEDAPPGVTDWTSGTARNAAGTAGPAKLDKPYMGGDAAGIPGADPESSDPRVHFPATGNRGAGAPGRAQRLRTAPPARTAHPRAREAAARPSS